MRFIAYLFYRYYSTGATKDISYFSTLCALVMLLGLHFFQILILLNGINFIQNANSRTENYFIIALGLIPVFLLLSFLIKESQLKKMKYDRLKIKKGNIFLILYIIASVALLIVLILAKKGQL